METKLSLAWRLAAQELGVRLIAPFELRADDGKPLSCTGLLPDFGGEKGTVIIGDQDPGEAVDVAHEHGSPDQVPPWFRGRVAGR